MAPYPETGPSCLYLFPPCFMNLDLKSFCTLLTHQGDDVDALKAKIQALSSASMKIGETLSGKSSANSSSSSSSGGSGGSDTGSSEEKKP